MEEEWGAVLGEEVMAAALIDRLVHHGHIVNIRGNNYRMRDHTELSRALLAFDDEPNTPPQRRRRKKAKEVTTN